MIMPNPASDLRSPHCNPRGVRPTQSALSCSRAMYEGPNGTIVTNALERLDRIAGTHLWMHPRAQRDGAGGRNPHLDSK